MGFKSRREELGLDWMGHPLTRSKKKGVPPKDDRVEQHSAGRTCSGGCGNLLSVYNSGSTCASCLRRGKGQRDPKSRLPGSRG